MISVFINTNPRNNKIISSLGNQVTINLNPGITLDDNKKISITLIKYELRIFYAKHYNKK